MEVWEKWGGRAYISKSDNFVKEFIRSSVRKYESINVNLYFYKREFSDWHLNGDEVGGSAIGV